MILKNHIAYRFLTDVTLQMEIMETMYPDQFPIFLEQLSKPDVPDDWTPESLGFTPDLIGLFHCLSPDNNKNYWITNTVLDKLEMLKVSKTESDVYNWKVFNNQPECKKTFIFPDNSFLRMNITEAVMHFNFARYTGSLNDGKIAWDMFFVKKDSGVQVNDYNKNEVEKIETTIFKLLCFIFLTENDEVVVSPGAKHGTRKDGKIINDLSVPITIVNSRWNTTVIRNEGFGVSGHFALRWAGVGKTEARIVFIEPFTKHGYIRKSKSA